MIDEDDAIVKVDEIEATEGDIHDGDDDEVTNDIEEIDGKEGR